MENSKGLHHAYWLQIAKAAGLSIPAALVKQVKKSENSYLNDIPLATWDNLPANRANFVAALRARGDNWSMSAHVCAHKALAKDLAGISPSA